MFNEYTSIVIFLVLSLVISFIIFTLSYLVVLQKADQEKVSAYECGFNPFDDARTTFDIRFYLVAVLVLIFDLETSFLFPWSLVLGELSLLGFWIMIVFLIVLTLGFVYEWYKGAFEWE